MKFSQADANYRRGYPFTQCGVCSMYTHGSDGGQYGGCTKVAGDITPYGLCRFYNMLDNPFGHKLTRNHRRIIHQVYDHARGGPGR